MDNKKDRRDEIILKQYEVIRSMAQHSFDSIASDFWGTPAVQRGAASIGASEDSEKDQPKGTTPEGQTAKAAVPQPEPKEEKVETIEELRAELDSYIGLGSIKKEVNNLINMALEYMTGALKKRCTTFLVSDFIDEHDYSKSLSIANHKHDVIAVQVFDKREAQLPDVGLMRVRDAERGTMRWVNTSSKRVRDTYHRWWYNQQQAVNSTLQRCNVDMASVATDEDYVTALMGLFQNRGVRR